MYQLLNIPKIIAANAFEGADLLNQAANTADGIAKGFDDLWTETINTGAASPAGGVWNSMCTVGTLFAVATLAFFMVEWTKNMLDGDEKRSYTELIWVIIVVALLANNGLLLGKATLGVRNYINNVNKFVLENAAASADLRASFQGVLEAQTARLAMGNAVNNCQQKSKTPQENVDCLKQAKQQFQSEFPSLFAKSGGNLPGPLKDMVQKIDRNISAVSDAIKNGANPLEIALSPINAAIGSEIMEFVTIIMLALNGAYQWAIELSFLLTALLGPLAVGGSLLPFGTKPIFAWLTGFFSVGMAKLSFNIITGFAGQLMATSRASQPMFFLFTIAIFAPFLASGIAAGGGLAVLTQINKASTFYTNLAIKVGSTVATGGMGGAASALRK
ncbi:MAG: hypothetical protein AAF378_00700 [Cyanobacteria bacterium P01_A01_bin.84]